MIQMFTARTSEIDESDTAIKDIQAQIDFSALKKYSGGIIFCHIDFAESGVVKALCDALPFDVIGMTSTASADAQAYGLYDLSLTVLTSDDVRFKVGMTESVHHDNYISAIEQTYTHIRQDAASDPALILAFAPCAADVSGYQLLDAMDSAASGIPLWGSITTGVDFNYEHVLTICNGEALRDGVAMMFLNGPVDPKFVIASIPEHNITNNRALVTKSEGAVLHQVNGMSILSYLNSIGLVVSKENITTIPLMVYYEGAKEPVALGFYNLYDDGSVLTGGAMPEGTSFCIGSINIESIIESAQRALDEVLTYKNRQATLLLPCVTRYIMLAPNSDEELQLVEKRLIADGRPFTMGYAGGEFCPMRGTDGKLHNRFHNYTFCACIL